MAAILVKGGYWPAQYGMKASQCATTEEMHLSIAPGVWIEQSARRRLAKLREEDLDSRLSGGACQAVLEHGRCCGT